MHRRRFLTASLTLAGAALSPAVARAAEPPAGFDPASGLFADDRRLGDPAARAVLVEYASLTCPHCAEFNNTMVPRLKTEWVASGKLLYVYRHFPLDGLALRAALAADCVAGERFFAVIDLLYRQQREWARADDPIAALRQIAGLAGLGPSAFDACLADAARTDVLLDRMLFATEAQGVQGTPTVFVNGVAQPAEDYEALAAAIAAAQA